MTMQTRKLILASGFALASLVAGAANAQVSVPVAPSTPIAPNTAPTISPNTAPTVSPNTAPTVNIAPNAAPTTTIAPTLTGAPTLGVLDGNLDGKLSKAETKGTAGLTGKFKKLDTDQDGFLGAEEYAAFVPVGKK